MKGHPFSYGLPNTSVGAQLDVGQPGCLPGAALLRVPGLGQLSRVEPVSRSSGEQVRRPVTIHYTANQLVVQTQQRAGVALKPGSNPPWCNATPHWSLQFLWDAMWPHVLVVHPVHVCSRDGHGVVNTSIVFSNTTIANKRHSFGHI